jgi:ubiquinone/menaquinone biosynthesis C-methylase UbiE
MDPLLHYFSDIRVHSILDIGTGTGGFIHILQKCFPEASITGIDPNVESLKAVAQHYPDIQFLEMEAEKLLLSDNSFDVVSISKALHHFPKVRRSLKEIKRVTKPGGYIIINEPLSDNLNPAQEVQKLYHHFCSRIDRLSGKFHRKTFTKNAILQILRGAELPIQFYFEQRNNLHLEVNNGGIEIRIEKMKSMLEKIKGFPEYDIMKPQIEEFRKKAFARGFQPASNLVIVIKKIT